ncbi:MAG TPA: hypothetical protein PLX35_16455 [Cyclobacteriaceae bacterium]|nr:hypothetical protein [Cyclobacteriaceae bacterium]
MADVNDQIRKATEISTLFDTMATTIFQKVKEERAAGKISFETYNQIAGNYYLPLMNYATKIHLDTENALTEDMAKELDKISRATQELNEVSSKVKRMESAFQAITSILASAAAVVSFVAAPSPMTAAAAISSMAGARSSIEGLVAAEK